MGFERRESVLKSNVVFNTKLIMKKQTSAYKYINIDFWDQNINKNILRQGVEYIYPN